MKILTSDKLPFLDKSLCMFLDEKHSSYEEYLKTINNCLVGVEDIRDRIVILGKLFTLGFENDYKCKWPYLFGGGHKNTFNNGNIIIKEMRYDSVNPYLGAPFSKEEIGLYAHKDGTEYPYYGYDCSSVIMLIWKIIGLPKIDKNTYNMIHGYISEKNNEIILPLGKTYLLGDYNKDSLINGNMFKDFYYAYNDQIHEIKPGDIIHRPGHVLMITEVNGTTYETIEEKGGAFGLVRTSVTMDDLVKDGKYSFISLDEFIKDPDFVTSKFLYEQSIRENKLINSGNSQSIR